VKRKVHQVQRKQTDSHKVCSKRPPMAWNKRVGHWSTASSTSDCSSSSMSWIWHWRHICVTCTIK